MEKKENESIWSQPEGFSDENSSKETISPGRVSSESIISGGKVVESVWSRPRSFHLGEVVDHDDPADACDAEAEPSSIWSIPNGFKGGKPILEDSRKPGSDSFKAVPVEERPNTSRPASDKLIWSNRRNRDVVKSAYFIAVSGNGSTKVFPVLDGQSIGSMWGTSDVPDIALSAAAASSQGRIVLEGDKLWYHNESARVSTFHNGIQAMDSRFELRYGDSIRIHDFLDTKCLNDTLLILAEKDVSGMTWETFSFPTKRDAFSKAKFEDARATGRSVTFSKKDTSVLLGGISSGTEVRINNRPMEEARQMAQMDVVQIGDAYFVFLGDSIVYPSTWRQSSVPRSKLDPAKGSLEIHIKDRTVREGFSGQKKLLSNIRLSIPKGSLVLVLGGSGAGKTTFVNAVMGYEPANGQIHYDGIDLYKEFNKMKYAIGYVQQEDLLRKTDIVLNTLMDAAKMHLPRDRKEQESAVSETLKLLGLEQEQKKLVGQLSGGQRKRLSIGVEYVGAPSLFFLDEPDSGLDGSNADNMWEIVRKIADTGKIVMVISHIPDRAFDRFDTVIVLAKDKANCGRLAFTGSPESACAFFETERLEEIVRRVNRVSEGGEGRADEFIKRFEEQRRLA
ncbi:MAG: ABC transporter ATP-binding protein [Clostridia bacterium]|nr:ABC transporter ATP-binding protein [Clostridia bacterium]